MNYTVYNYFMKYHLVVNVIFMFLLVFTLWNALDENERYKMRSFLSIAFPRVKKHKTYDDFFWKQQRTMFGIVVLLNLFIIATYNDYYRFTLHLTVVISVIQIVALLRIFIIKKTENIDKHLIASFVLGMISIFLAFTFMYCCLFPYFHDGFEDFVYHMDDKFYMLNKWLECLCYAISLVIPYSLTSLSVNTYIMKFISLIQIIIFYVFVWKKLKPMFGN